MTTQTDIAKIADLVLVVDGQPVQVVPGSARREIVCEVPADAPVRIPTPAGHEIDLIPGGDSTKPGVIKPEECAKRYPEALWITRRVGREYGYAIAVHGSQIRDLDLIAVPWTTGARPTLEFVRALELALCGFITERTVDGVTWPQQKPHGRRAWTIHLGAGPYIDLSVVPVIGSAGSEDRAGGNG